MFLLNFDGRISLVFIPLILAASWALFNVIFALRNNFRKVSR